MAVLATEFSEKVEKVTGNHGVSLPVARHGPSSTHLGIYRSSAYKEVGKQEEWWASGNIFARDVLEETVRKLQKGLKPKHAGYADYVRKNIRPIRGTDLDASGGSQEWYIQLLDEQVRCVYELPDGHRAGFDLEIHIKLNVLQGAHELVLEQHAKIDKELTKRLRTKYAARPPDEEQNYVDAAKACRDLRVRMSRHPCRARKEEMCIYNILLPTLDTLQRRAYEEIRLKVSTAIGNRLPAELIFLVFENTMAAEEVPLDPRIFVTAKLKNQNDYVRKTRLICNHSPSTSAHVRLIVGRPAFAWGGNWIETKPMFMHHNPTLRWREDERFQDCNPGSSRNLQQDDIRINRERKQWEHHIV